VVTMPPSVHPNGNRYDWNGKAPHLITRQELNEFIRLIRPNQSPIVTDYKPPAVVTQAAGAHAAGTTRTLSMDKMQELLNWIKPYYNEGQRDSQLYCKVDRCSR
jgi:hypothetical protein